MMSTFGVFSLQKKKDKKKKKKKDKKKKKKKVRLSHPLFSIPGFWLIIRVTKFTAEDINV